MMKRFHNPMSFIMLIILAVFIIATTFCFLIFESLKEIFFVYWILIAMYAIIAAIVFWGEYKFKKSDEQYSKEIGEDYNTAEAVSDIMKKSSKKETVLVALGIIVFSGTIAAIGMYNTALGIATIVIIIAVVIIIAEYNTKEYKTVDEYLSAPRLKKALPYLRVAHEVVIKVDPDIQPATSKGDILSSLAYYYEIDEETHEVIEIFAMCYFPHRNNIRISLSNPYAYEIFAAQIADYKRVDNWLLLPLDESFDYNLIENIIKYNIECIKQILSQNTEDEDII